MTRCPEFYEKVKRDGNFCGMSDKEYRRLVQYTEEVEKDEVGNATISQGEWLKQKKEQAVACKLVEPQKPKEPKHQTKVEFMEECTAFWVKARKLWSEEVIEEVLDKARVNSR